MFCATYSHNLKNNLASYTPLLKTHTKKEFFLMLLILFTDLKNPITYIPIAILFAAALTLLHRLLTTCPSHTSKSPHRSLLVFLLLTYTYITLQFAFFSRPPGSRSTISLIPGATWGTTLQSHAYVIENILMTIPLGILLPSLWPGDYTGHL